jgi:hypothetical protein
VKSRESTVASILLVCWAAVYLPSLLAGRTLPARDVAATQIPWRTVWREQVRAGHLPVWDPLSNQGRPLLANPNAMAGYPGTLLFLVLEPEAAAAWHIALHHLVLLLACYLIARRSGARPGAAAVAGAATATAGVVWSSLTFLNTEASLAWAAVAVATALPHSPVRPLHRSLVAGIGLGLAFLAGEPVVAALGAVAWAAVVATTWRPFPAAALPVAAAAACGVAAPVLVPLIAIYPDTIRAALGVAPGALAADALAPRRWIELLLPSVLGPPLGDGESGFWAAASFPWQRYLPLVFLGATPLLTLPLARRSGRRLGAWWGLFATGVIGAVVLSVAPIAAAVAALPGLGAVRYGIKLLLLAVLAMPPLVAAGYERLAALTARRRRAIAGALVALAGALVVVTAASPTLPRAALASLYPRSRSALARVDDGELRRRIIGDAAALALPATALVVTAAAAPLVAATLVANVFSGSGVLAFDDGRRWREPPALVSQLPAGATVAAFAVTAAPPAPPGNPALARFWRSRTALLPEYGTRWGFAYALTRGPDGLEPLRRELLAAEAAHLPPGEQARVAAALGAVAVIGDEPLAEGVSHEVDGVWLTPLPDAAPAAYLARRALPCEGIPAAVRSLASTSFRPGIDAVTEGTGGAAELGGGSVAALGGPPHDRRYAVDLVSPGLLVVQQSFMRCWHARVDGAPAAVEVANGAELGVRVPAGRHTVELLVDARPARLGLLGPLLVLAALVATRRAGSSRDRADASGAAGRSTPATPPAP